MSKYFDVVPGNSEDDVTYDRAIVNRNLRHSDAVPCLAEVVIDEVVLLPEYPCGFGAEVLYPRPYLRMSGHVRSITSADKGELLPGNVRSLTFGDTDAIDGESVSFGGAEPEVSFNYHVNQGEYQYLVYTGLGLSTFGMPTGASSLETTYTLPLDVSFSYIPGNEDTPPCMFAHIENADGIDIDAESAGYEPFCYYFEPAPELERAMAVEDEQARAARRERDMATAVERSRAVGDDTLADIASKGLDDAVRDRERLAVMPDTSSYTPDVTDDAQSSTDFALDVDLDDAGAQLDTAVEDAAEEERAAREEEEETLVRDEEASPVDLSAVTSAQRRDDEARERMDALTPDDLFDAQELFGDVLGGSSDKEDDRERARSTSTSVVAHEMATDEDGRNVLSHEDEPSSAGDLYTP
jgi:hypothetical protein